MCKWVLPWGHICFLGNWPHSSWKSGSFQAELYHPDSVDLRPLTAEDFIAEKWLIKTILPLLGSFWDGMGPRILSLLGFFQVTIISGRSCPGPDGCWGKWRGTHCSVDPRRLRERLRWVTEHEGNRTKSALFFVFWQLKMWIQICPLLWPGNYATGYSFYIRRLHDGFLLSPTLRKRSRTSLIMSFPFVPSFQMWCILKEPRRTIIHIKFCFVILYKPKCWCIYCVKSLPLEFFVWLTF